MDSIKLLWYCFISERGRRIASLDKMKENSRKIGQLSVFPDLCGILTKRLARISTLTCQKYLILELIAGSL